MKAYLIIFTTYYFDNNITVRYVDWKTDMLLFSTKIFFAIFLKQLQNAMVYSRQINK